MIELESSSPEETERIGAAVARELEPGDVVAVSGELGTGKTTFVRGAARALGIAGPVTSPTYTIGHRYSGKPDVSHLVFVEWPEAGDGVLPAARVSVRLRHAGEEHRLVSLETSEKALEIRLSTGVDPRV